MGLSQGKYKFERETEVTCEELEGGDIEGVRERKGKWEMMSLYFN